MQARTHNPMLHSTYIKYYEDNIKMMIKLQASYQKLIAAIHLSLSIRLGDRIFSQNQLGLENV